MFRLLLLISILVGFLSSGYGQISYFTYYEGCVLREKPTVNSNIIMSLPIKTPLHSFDGSNGFSLYDTINNQPGSWVNIEYKGHSGYIWEHLISDNSFVTHQGELVLIKKNKDDYLEYKLFDGDSLIVNKKDMSYKGHFKHRMIKDGSGFFGLENVYFTNNNGLVTSFTLDKYDIHFTGIEKPNDSDKTKFEELINTQIGLAVGSHINIRMQPNNHSDIIGKLNNNQVVDIDSVGEFLRYENQWGRWIYIDYKGRKGYVWNQFLIESQKLYKQKSTEYKFFLSYRKIAVLDKNNEVISELVLTEGIEGNNYGWIKNQSGFIRPSPYTRSGIDDAIIGIQLGYGEMDVQGSFTDYILWNGNTLKKIYRNKENGEMGYSNSEQYMYLKNLNGIKDIILKEKYIDSEFIQLYDNSINYLGITMWNDYRRIGYYKFMDDSLVEIPSRISQLENKLQEQSNSIKIQNYKYLDFNNDGLLDIVFYASKIKAETDQYFASKSMDYLGYALGQKDSTFNIIQLNNTLLKDSRSVMITLVKDGFEIYNAKWLKKVDVDDYYVSFMKSTFLYNSQEDRFYIKSKQQNWDQELFYKKHPLLLENAY